MASYRNDALVEDKERAVEQLAEAWANEVVTLHSEVQWPRSMMSANLTNPLTVATPNLKICKVLSGVELEQRLDDIIAIIDPLLSTTKSLTIRTVAYPSAPICISTAQKLIMLLDMIKVPKDFEETRVAWHGIFKEGLELAYDRLPRLNHADKLQELVQDLDRKTKLVSLFDAYDGRLIMLAPEITGPLAAPTRWLYRPTNSTQPTQPY